jgi:hypothetical protein
VGSIKGPAMTYQPKGGMCAACRHRLEDCSALPFSAMPAMTTTDDAIIVRCTEFENANRPAWRQARRRAAYRLHTRTSPAGRSSGFLRNAL